MSTKRARHVYESFHSKVFLVDPSNYQDILHYASPRKVAMKILKNESPDPNEIERFYKEYEVSQTISHPGICKVLAKAKLKNKHAVFFEWVKGKGITIRDYGRREMKEFLSLSQQIVDALAELHMHRYVHNSLSPNNIVVNPASGQIKIVDLSQYSMIGERINRLDDPDAVEGDLQFISPDVVVDYRSDLYSLGCTFYFMLTGKVPFESEDQLQLLEMHKAYHPPSLNEVDPTIPAPLSSLIQKLMNKNPEDRYQSARGVLYDLNLMVSQFQSEAGIASDFILARRDCSGQLQLSQKLYGRTDQIAILQSAFERVRTGAFETVLITGNSGTGKSSIVNEVQMPVKKTGGYFIAGKYDPLQLFEPYSGILQAFTKLCDLLLAESKEMLDYIRMTIQEALGDEGKIITDIMPKLHSIIGDQPDVPEVGGIETKNRFNYVFRKFVRVISSDRHPILLFIDDLQWADSASLDLISVLMMDKEMKYLLFVGAYRDDEVDDSHPFTTVLDSMKNDVTIQTIEVHNLDRDDTNKLISDSLNDTREDTSYLTDVVHGKTLGNVFFVIQFLKSLVQEKLLYFCYDDFKWNWDIEKIRRKYITENVVDFMSEKVVKLPKNTQVALQIASCFGSPFDLFLLQLVFGDEDVTNLLQEAYFEGLIIPGITEHNKYHFSHDRIQQAVYSLIPESDRGILHLRIGRVLQKKLMELTQLDENLFVVVNHLNADLDMIVDESERAEIARLNFQAAERARMSSAFEIAAGYSSTGIMLLGPNRWTKDYELSLKLYYAAAEMGYCNGDFDHMNEMLGEVFENVTSVPDKVESFSLLTKALRAQQKNREALDTGLRVLELLQEKFPPEPNQLLVAHEFNKTKGMMLNKSNDVIASLPTMEDKTTISVVRMMCEILPSAQMASPTLSLLLSLRVVQLTTDHGFTKHAIQAFGWYGASVCVMKDFEEGYRIGQLLLKLLGRFPGKECQCWVNGLVYGMINHWKEKIHLSLKPLQHTIRVGRDVGENDYSFFMSWRYCCHLFLAGVPLVKLEKEMKFYCDQIKACKQQQHMMVFAPFCQAVLNFMGRGSEDPTKLEGEAFSEESMETFNIKENVFAGVSFHVYGMILAYFFQEYDEAAKRAKECEKLLQKVKAIYENSNYVFYHGLISLALVRETKNDSKWMKIANESIAYMRNLAEIAPDNFLHKTHLLEAELAAVNGHSLEAFEHFHKAINLAEDQSFMHEMALACERAGIYCIGTKQNFSAAKFLSRAYRMYREWGAEAKALHLQKLYGERIG